MSPLVALGLLAVLHIIGPQPASWAVGALAVGWATLHPGRIERLVGCLAFGMVLPLWQVSMGVALGGFLLLERRRPDGWARGSVPVLPTLLAAAVTPIGLVGWFTLTNPNLSDIAATYLPDVPTAALVAGAILFVAVNATLEEAIWRGVFQPELAARWGVPVAIAVQAASFGIAHTHGFPRGVLGVTLAGGWAGLLGYVRHKSGGLWAPLLAHLVADSVIAVIVLTRL